MKILNLILDFAKKNWKYTILILAVLAISVRGCIRDGIIKNQAAKIAELNMSNFTLDNDRKSLEAQLKILQEEYSVIDKSNDSLKLVLKQKEKALKDMIVEHQKEVEALLNVPADTIYKILQTAYPNYSGEEQRFRFGTDQIRPIYGNYLELPRLQQEFSLQSKTLKSCLTLNDGFETATANLTGQINNLKADIAKADLQIGNYKKTEVILNKQVASNKFWKNTGFLTTAIAVIIAILK
jgi:hypothetical protein